MKHISTSATAINKIKAAAKKIKQIEGVPLAKALDLAAQAAGYEHYHHATSCAVQTQKASASKMLGMLEYHVASDNYTISLYDEHGNPNGTSEKTYGEFRIKQGEEALYKVSDELDALLEMHGGDSGDMGVLSKRSLVAIAKKCEQLIEKEPAFLDGYGHWVGALVELGKHAEAVRIGEPVFMAACALIPGNFKGVIPYYLLGNRPFHRLAVNLLHGYYGVGNVKAAKTIVKQMLKWWPNDNIGFRFLSEPPSNKT